MDLGLLPKVNLDYYTEYLKMTVNHWLNGTCYDSGSLLNLWDLANLKDPNNEKWSYIFSELSEQDNRISDDIYKRFQYLIGNLVDKNVIENVQINLRDVRYIYGGTDIVSVGNEKYDIVAWGKDKNKEYPHSIDKLKEIVKSQEFNDHFTSVKLLSWHKGLVAEIGNLNHRIGCIAAILDLNPELIELYSIKTINKYTINQDILKKLLTEYSVYIALDIADDIFLDLDNLGYKYGVFCLDLAKCDSLSLSRLYFQKYNAKIYFFRKTYSNFLLRSYLNSKMHNNELVFNLLSSKSTHSY